MSAKFSWKIPGFSGGVQPSKIDPETESTGDKKKEVLKKIISPEKKSKPTVSWKMPTFQTQPMWPMEKVIESVENKEKEILKKVINPEKKSKPKMSWKIPGFSIQ